MRDVFVDGKLPRTASDGQDPADTISPQGAASQDINFASCGVLLELTLSGTAHLRLLTSPFALLLLAIPLPALVVTTLTLPITASSMPRSRAPLDASERLGNGAGPECYGQGQGCRLLRGPPGAAHRGPAPGLDRARRGGPPYDRSRGGTRETSTAS